MEEHGCRTDYVGQTTDLSHLLQKKYLRRVPHLCSNSIVFLLNRLSGDGRVQIYVIMGFQALLDALTMPLTLQLIIIIIIAFI